MAAGSMLGGCATGAGAGSAKLPDFAWGALLHLGSNMWDGFDLFAAARDRHYARLG